MIYTSYFEIIKTLPENVVPISIAAEAPDRYYGASYKPLAPGYDLLMQYRMDGDEKRYAKEYYHQIRFLNATRVVYDLARIAKGKDICLVCYEKPSNFCHRRIVSEWLNSYGYICKEWDENEREE